MELCDIVCPACLNYWSLISLSYIHLFFLYPMSCSIGHFVFPQSSIWSTAFISDTDVPLCLDAKLLSILTPSLSLFFSHSYSLSHTISLIHSFSLSYSSSLLFLSHSLSSPHPPFSLQIFCSHDILQFPSSQNVPKEYGLFVFSDASKYFSLCQDIFIMLVIYQPCSIILL